jgi:hypothetical protein
MGLRQSDLLTDSHVLSRLSTLLYSTHIFYSSTFLSRPYIFISFLIRTIMIDFLLLDPTSRWSTYMCWSATLFSCIHNSIPFVAIHTKCQPFHSSDQHDQLTFVFRGLQRLSFGLLFRFESHVILVLFLFNLLWCLPQLSD